MNDRAALLAEIAELKTRHHAVILCHNYQPAEIFPVADYIGDSLELARKAAETDSELIVFCGVRFMAETAKLLSPRARVILPAPAAGCQMADMVSAEALRARREELGDVAAVAYVNTTAAVKAESDICCTSANAVRVVESLPPDRPVLFVPDRNLARWVAHESGRAIIPWEGFCYVHALFTVADVARARREHPGVPVACHPECPLEVLEAADHVASTGGMYRLAREHAELVLGTEVGMCDRIRFDFPENRCWPLRRTAVCRNMKLTTLELVRDALASRVEEVTVPEPVAGRARAAIERMLAAS
ncbi:quinolinate synthase NadA [candidate division WOR-3 bacterium]|nr:quinolinate synthase NadA [candidate division WOR-3 bacterium]